MLNQEQLAFYNDCIAYINRNSDAEDENLMMLLMGYAGTGKTFTSGKLIKNLLLMQHKRVAVTAPTNKAVKVAKQLASYKHAMLQYKTIHSLLGLKMDIDDNGVEHFIPSTDPNDQPAIYDIDVLIIDESSMLNDELTDMIIPYVNEGAIKLIFMGDPIQIPPVNKADSYPFIKFHQKRLRIGVHELTQIVRQKEDNPILALATCIRENYRSDMIPFELKTTIVNRSGIVMIDKNDKATALAICEMYFGNVRFKEDSDFMKVIAWTNKTVDIMNRQIRKIIYQDEEDLQKLMPGEKLIADSPIVEKNGVYREVLYTTNDEFEVESYVVEDMKVFQEYKVKTYYAKVFHINEKGNKVTHTIPIIHEQGEAQFREILNLLVTRAKTEKDKFERKAKFRLFYEIKNKFAEVKYNYAITAHKSQGSTYENAMVIWSDIDKNRKIEERNRIKYVACTRSRNLLFILN